jgi:hypothetical protein
MQKPNPTEPAVLSLLYHDSKKEKKMDVIITIITFLTLVNGDALRSLLSVRAS